LKAGLKNIFKILTFFCIVSKNKYTFAQILIKITNKKMKKLFTLVAVATFSLVACGPSAEEKAAAEKAKQDSIQAYNDAEAAKAAAEAQRIADSTTAAAAEAAAKAVADSTAAYEASKGKKK
jgi:uncharacterized lipoprotein YehR (DUF1307 family)